MDKLKVYELPMNNNYKVPNNMKRLQEKLKKNRYDNNNNKFKEWLNKDSHYKKNEDIINDMIEDISKLFINKYEFDNFKQFKDELATYIYYNSHDA